MRTVNCPHTSWKHVIHSSLIEIKSWPRVAAEGLIKPEEKLVICYKFFESKYYRGKTTASALTISWYENKYTVLRVPRGTENGIQNDQATIASYWLHNTASNKQQRQVQVSRNHQNQVNILKHWTNQEYNSNLQLQQQQQTSLQIFDFNSSSSSNITWEHHSKRKFQSTRGKTSMHQESSTFPAQVETSASTNKKQRYSKIYVAKISIINWDAKDLTSTSELI